jgi:hypothetical protein
MILAVSTAHGSRGSKPNYVLETVTRPRLSVPECRTIFFAKYDAADVEFLLSDWLTEHKRVCRPKKCCDFLITVHLILVLI